MELTAKERRLLVYLVGHYEDKGYMPSVREAAKQMGWKSHFSVQRLLDRFRDRGWITEGHPRVWMLTPAGRRAAK